MRKVAAQQPTPSSDADAAASPCMLGVPRDALGHVLEYLDGDALLCTLEVTGAWQTATCEAAWRAAQERQFPGALCPDLAWGPERYRLSRARFAGVFVVELGACGERAGIHWAAAPTRVRGGWTSARDAARRAELAAVRAGAARPFERPARPFEDPGVCAARVADALARGCGIASLRDLSVLVLAPHFASRWSAARVVARLLDAGCRRVRVEHAAVCALVAATAEDRPEDLPAAVVLDVGARRATASPLRAGGRVPPDVVESSANVHGHKYTTLRSPVAGDAVSDVLAPFCADADAAKRDHAYVRHASPDAAPPKAEELEFARVTIGGATIDRQRFDAAEILFAPMPAPVAAALPSIAPAVPASAPPNLPTLACRAAARAAAPGGGRVATVVLAGGGAAIRGLGRRLRRELRAEGAPAAPWASAVDVVPPDEASRVDLAWRGAARLARAADRRWVSAEAFGDGKARVDEKTGLVVDNWDGLVEGIARELLHL